MSVNSLMRSGSVISSQLNAELIEIRHRLEPLRMLGLTTTNDDDDDSRISKIEELYLKEVQLALQNTPYEVWSQAYLDGMECDLIITMKSSPTCDHPIITTNSNNNNSNSYHNSQTIVVNIEIDGPHHKQPKKLQYTRLRDEYFRQRHGVSVRRVDASSSSSSSSRRDGSKKQYVAEIVMGILKEEMKLI